jgi:hypothetical protein
MLKNLDSDNDIEVGYTRSGRVFKEVHFVNLFKKNYEDKGFYNGEEAYLIDEENSEPIGIEGGKAEELCWEETETLETA